MTKEEQLRQKEQEAEITQLTGGLESSQDENPYLKQEVLVRVKSVTKLERLYMIDIVEHGKKEIELVMHFVNKHYNPTMSPVIKRFRMTLDLHTRFFLSELQRQIATHCHLVSKVANA